MIRSIGVFCGSSAGDNEIYRKAATELGALMAREQITLVYGGRNIGMMGAIADSMLENNGRVIGLIPESLIKKEIAQQTLKKCM